MSDRRRNGFILLLVAGLIAASVAVIATKQTFLGLDLKGGVELVYQGERTAQSNVTPQALSRAVDIMRQRVDQLGVSQPSITTQGSNQIDVQLPDVKDTTRAEAEVGTTARLFFFDWEANALTPNGKTVASQLLAQDATAREISQGGGQPNSGSQSLYAAIQTADKVTNPPVGTFNSQGTARYYAFGAPGSAACTAAGKYYDYIPIAGQRCYLNSGTAGETRAQVLAGLPPGVSQSEAQVLEVPRGVVVIEAIPTNLDKPPKISAPTTQFYALLDHFAVQGSDVTNPQQSTDSSGQPDVAFNLTAKGAREFQSVTAQIARRGEINSLQQHFATTLDTQLVTAPTIDYNTYPDGIIGSSAEITGSFTIQSAQNLANELRLGALPINLRLISEQQVSASLGKQALHQGLLAGAIGLLVVILFLLVYYRVLGVIATAGLAIYALYFYALIKLIPITLSLSGIAGLILTIGVAADANIVIFERVKEEIRAGRSIRQGIITGYKKGLTAIVDANVVTIMTAFILFVLATSDVKGFAFTLGIGTIVSLFTAVMATQAILMTMGSSRTISQPSALGAGGKKHVWRYDFMGASRYFFSLSGCILLIGALAIGGRGLNLGIDFTSGTQARVGLVKPATQQQVLSFVQSIGAHNASVQKISGKSVGANTFQIDFNKYKGTRDSFVSALQSRFGVQQNGADINYTSVGPTFGATVAHSAIVAIIASLIVISLYIALRFEWKFAVPVLIALMHDLLITSGVYALTGRTVTADTVAALLTILGYSLYDTIIVFDRVRENIPRMPRAAFSQIVNRSMSEVLTRSLATTSCTLLPVIALLLFGGSTLKDFAFALLIGVASGAYSSIFIASPVLTHWKEREPGFKARRHRIEEDFGAVPAYAGTGADVEPARGSSRRAGRLTAPDPDTVSAAEFEKMKRDLEIEEPPRTGKTSTLTRRLAHTDEEQAPTPPSRSARRPAAQPAAAPTTPVEPTPAPDGNGDGATGDEHISAPDVAENEGMVRREPKPKSRGAAKSKSRNRRHGRR
jgi:SecD/SecF fusion protein